MKQIKTSSLFAYMGAGLICNGCKHRGLRFEEEPCKSCESYVSPSNFQSFCENKKVQE